MAPRDFEPSSPWGAPSRFLSRDITATVARESWQVDAYFRLRRDIFEREQGLFSDSDVDEHDAHATPIVALSHVDWTSGEILPLREICALARARDVLTLIDGAQSVGAPGQHMERERQHEHRGDEGKPHDAIEDEDRDGEQPIEHGGLQLDERLVVEQQRCAAEDHDHHKADP